MKWVIKLNLIPIIITPIPPKYWESAGNFENNFECKVNNAAETIEISSIIGILILFSLDGLSVLLVSFFRGFLVHCFLVGLGENSSTVLK